MQKKGDLVGSKASNHMDLFVDSSGYGADDEGALTMAQFIDTIRTLGAGYAYGIEETGQFQVNIRVMQPSGKGGV
jgi:hypothetical protein